MDDICAEKSILEETTSLLLNQSNVFNGGGCISEPYNSLKSDYKKVISQQLPSINEMNKPVPPIRSLNNKYIF